MTLTVTEAGYVRDGSGRLDQADPAVADDLTALRRWLAGTPLGDPPQLRTAPAQVGRRAGCPSRGRRLARSPSCPCDNLPDNGRVAGPR